jgi:hypothetical protein
MRDPTSGGWGGPILYVGGALAVVIVMLQRKPDYIYWNKILSESQHIRWTDLYASRDPVPNGPLDNSPSEQLSGSPVVDSKIIHNFGSFLFDHVTYFENQEQVIATIAFKTAQCAGVTISDMNNGDDIRIQVAEERRRWRVRRLEMARYVAIASGAAYLVTVALNQNQRPSVWVAVLWLFSGKVDANTLLNAVPVLFSLGGVVFLYWVTLLSWKYWTQAEMGILVRRAEYTVKSSAVAPLTMFYCLVGIQMVEIIDNVRGLIPDETMLRIFDITDQNKVGSPDVLLKDPKVVSMLAVYGAVVILVIAALIGFGLCEFWVQNSRAESELAASKVKG